MIENQQHVSALCMCSLCVSLSFSLEELFLMDGTSSPRPCSFVEYSFTIPLSDLFAFGLFWVLSLVLLTGSLHVLCQEASFFSNVL